MTNLPPPLNPPLRILLGPGPSDVNPRVLAALAAPTVGHLDPYYLKLMNGMQQLLREVFRTRNEMTLAVSGTGSAGMEAAVVNLIEPGDPMVVCVNGVFGGRMAEVAARAGAVVTRLERPWGDVFTPDDLRPVLAQAKPKVVGIVMAETSTGAWQPIEELARLVHEAGALLLVDAVTALGGVPVEVDGWGIDAIYSGSQKCLGCPPGLAPLSLGLRAMEKVGAEVEGAELVSRCDAAGPILEPGAGLPPHGPDQHDVWPVRGAAASDGRRPGKLLRPAHAESPCSESRLGGSGHSLHGPRGASTADAQRRADSRRRGRHRCATRPVGTVRHRNRRRAGRIQRQGLADRPDGLRLSSGQRAAVSGGARSAVSRARPSLRRWRRCGCG